MQQNTRSLSAILAPIVKESARLAAQEEPKAALYKHIYWNGGDVLQPVCDRNGVPFVAPYDVN
jgi:hypothetical protein